MEKLNNILNNIKFDFINIFKKTLDLILTWKLNFYFLFFIITGFIYLYYWYIKAIFLISLFYFIVFVFVFVLNLQINLNLKFLKIFFKNELGVRKLFFLFLFELPANYAYLFFYIILNTLLDKKLSNYSKLDWSEKILKGLYKLIFRLLLGIPYFIVENSIIMCYKIKTLNKFNYSSLNTYFYTIINNIVVYYTVNLEQFDYLNIIILSRKTIIFNPKFTEMPKEIKHVSILVSNEYIRSSVLFYGTTDNKVKTPHYTIYTEISDNEDNKIDGLVISATTKEKFTIKNYDFDKKIKIIKEIFTKFPTKKFTKLEEEIKNIEFKQQYHCPYKKISNSNIKIFNARKTQEADKTFKEDIEISSGFARTFVYNLTNKSDLYFEKSTLINQFDQKRITFYPNDLSKSIEHFSQVKKHYVEEIRSSIDFELYEGLITPDDLFNIYLENNLLDLNPMEFRLYDYESTFIKK